MYEGFAGHILKLPVFLYDGIKVAAAVGVGIYQVIAMLSMQYFLVDIYCCVFNKLFR